MTTTPPLRQLRRPNLSGAQFNPVLAVQLEKQVAAAPLPLETNSKQTTETGSKRIANGKQTDSKRIAETDSKEIAAAPLLSETGSTTDSKENQNRQQTDSKRIANGAVFESLVGHEKRLLLLVFRECSRVGNLVSPELTLLHIAEVLKCTPGTAKSAIMRVVEKGFISREKKQNGTRRMDKIRAFKRALSGPSN